MSLLEKVVFFWLIFALGGPASISHAGGGAGLRLDHRLGHLGQNDLRLNKAKLSSKPNDSMLCGPTCFVNFLPKVRASAGLSEHPDPEKELEHLLNVVAKKAGLSRSRIIKKGITIDQLQALIQVYLKDLGIDAETTIYSVFPEGTDQPGVKDFDFSVATDDRTAVIANFGYFPVADPTATPFSHGVRSGGHYALAAGGSDEDPNTIFLNDPSRGTRVVWLNRNVEFMETEHKGIWLRGFTDSIFPESSVITSLLVIKFK